MKRQRQSSAVELRQARSIWGKLGAAKFKQLRRLVESHQLSVANGDVKYVEQSWYITHSGLIGLAEREGCAGIKVTPVKEFCDAAGSRWVFKAIVYKSRGSKGFVGYGDADPSNVSPSVRGAELRVAETRAVARALRKAYGIGLCSVEELGHVAAPSYPSSSVAKGTAQPASNGNGTCNGQPRLRDRLSLLIRQHQLDPAAVKLFAAEFCGTHELREASREMVESFIQHLAEWASKDRDGLLCKLNGYSTPPEVRS
jgi:hypothetical protein